MSNIATLLKAEVARLTRKELKLQLDPLRKEVAAQRNTIAALRADITKLQRGIPSSDRNEIAVQRAKDAPVTRARFSASGLKALRKRLGLSLNAFGILLGVRGQAIYKWESGLNHPRAEAVQKIAIVRGMTKQQAEDLLAQHASSAKKAEGAAANKAAATAAAKKAVGKTPAKTKPKAAAKDTAASLSKQGRYKRDKKVELQGNAVPATN